MSRLAVLTLLGLVISFAPQAAFAREDSDKLKKVETEMLWQKRKAAALEQDSKETAGDLHNLRQKLIDASEALKDKEEEQQKVEERMRGLEKEIAAKKKVADKNRRDLDALTSVLIRLGQQPPESWFLKAGLTDEHIHRAVLARALLPRLQAESETTARDLVVLADLRWIAQEQKRLVVAAEENLKGQRSSLDQLVKARQGLLNRTESQKEAIAKHLVSLTSQAQNLRQLLAKVAPPGSRQRATPATLRMTLEKPVAGAISRRYGAKDSDGITSRGLTYVTSPSSRVVAPQAGRVVFAGPFRGYGQILILQHKGGYHSFLAGFGRIDAEVGQEVAAGEPLGIMPDRDDSGRPELYFEWRRNGEPLDPMEQKFRNR